MELSELLVGIEFPGRLAAEHSHWVFPILSESPERLRRHLVRHGFDATRGASSLFVLPPPPDRPHLRAAKAEAMYERLLYLPVHSQVTREILQRLAAVVNSFMSSQQHPVVSPTAFGL